MSKFKSQCVSFSLINKITGAFNNGEVRLCLPRDKHMTGLTVLLRDRQGKLHVARRGGSTPSQNPVGYTDNSLFKDFGIVEL